MRQLKECPNCGIDFDLDTRSCPKCELPVTEFFQDRLIIVDVAHHGEDWEIAREKIEKAIDEALYLNVKGLKIIHGRGSKHGHTRIIALNTRSLLKSVAKQHGAKLVSDKHTDGAHILYFNT